MAKKLKYVQNMYKISWLAELTTLKARRAGQATHDIFFSLKSK